MMARAFQDHQIRDYLLGNLPAEQESALETAYFGDPDLLARVELAREDLADDYAAVRLSPADREKFERRILITPEGREQVAIAKALQKASSIAPERGSGAEPVKTSGVVLEMPRRTAWRLDRRWLSLAAVIPIAIGVLVALRMWGPSNIGDRARTIDETRTQSTPSTPTPAPPGAGTATSQPSPGAPSVGPSPDVPAIVVATLILSADLDRSAGAPPTLSASTDATHVELVAPRIGVTSGTARARVETVEGTPVWSGSITIPDAKDPDPRPRVRLPRSALPPGDHFFVIESSPRDAAGEPRYYFRVRAQ